MAPLAPTPRFLRVLRPRARLTSIVKVKHLWFFGWFGPDWTDDEELATAVRDAYSGSIGRWKRIIEEDYGYEVLEAWYRYKDDRIDEMMDEFLRKHGIEPE